MLQNLNSTLQVNFLDFSKNLQECIKTGYGIYDQITDVVFWIKKLDNIPGVNLKQTGCNALYEFNDMVFTSLTLLNTCFKTLDSIQNVSSTLTEASKNITEKRNNNTNGCVDYFSRNQLNNTNGNGVLRLTLASWFNSIFSQKVNNLTSKYT
jgi:hypothetical protein